MRVLLPVRTVALPIAILVGASLTACGGSSGGKADPGTAPSTPLSSSTAAPTSSAPAHLSKADFVAKMNAVCSSVDTQRKALPVPTGPTDYTALHTFAAGSIKLVPSFIAQATELVAQSADKDALTSNWLTFEQSDFAVAEPLLTAIATASAAHDGTKVESASAQLDQAPDHSRSIAAYMKTYGLTDCATLELS